MADEKIVSWIDFENEVYKRVKRWLREEKFCLSGIRAVAYRKKSYFSEARKANIEFEVVIEAFDKGGTEPSLIWVWECKDNSKSGRDVEVKDVEVLCSKIDQLGRSRLKASLVTTHGFQSAAFQLAISNGISLFTLHLALR